MSQLDEAKIIKEYRLQNKTYSDIGKILDKDPEACRSILRRYESDLNNDLEILNILDNEVSGDNYFTSRKTEKICKEIDDYEKLKGYGKYLIINDLHEPFSKRKLLKEILLHPEVRKIDTVIILGDLFQMDIASKFPVDRDELIGTSLDKGSELLEVLSNQFKQVYIIEGNHDRHPKRELTKVVKNGLKRLVRDVSPIQTIIDELFESNGITNIKFNWGNELRLGNVMLAHPDYFASASGQTVIGIADTYLAKNREITGVIIGHTHQAYSSYYKGIAVYENCCLCMEMDYTKGARKHTTPWTLGYGIYVIGKDGNLNVKESKLIPLI